MTKVPYRLQIELHPDDSGLEFSTATAMFSYYIAEDGHCSGHDKVILTLDAENEKICKGFFDVCLEAASQKHGTVTKDKVPKFFPSVPDVAVKPKPFDPAAVALPEKPTPRRAAAAEPSMWGKVKDFVMGR